MQLIKNNKSSEEKSRKKRKFKYLELPSGLWAGTPLKSAGQFWEPSYAPCAMPLHPIEFEFVSFFFLVLRLCLLISSATLWSVGQRLFLILAAVFCVLGTLVTSSLWSPAFHLPLQLFSNKSCQLIYSDQPAQGNFFATVSERAGCSGGVFHWKNIYEPIIQTTFHCGTVSLCRLLLWLLDGPLAT